MYNITTVSNTNASSFLTLLDIPYTFLSHSYSYSYRTGTGTGTGTGTKRKEHSEWFFIQENYTQILFYCLLILQITTNISISIQLKKEPRYIG